MVFFNAKTNRNLLNKMWHDAVIGIYRFVRFRHEVFVQFEFH